MSGSDLIIAPLKSSLLVIPTLNARDSQRRTGIQPEISTHSGLLVIPTKVGIQSVIFIHSGDSRSVHNKGFSLFEVLIALTVLTIVTGLAVVSLGPFWQKHQLRQTTGNLMEQIQVCRMKAVVEQKTYQIKIAGQVLFRRYKSGMDWSDWETYRFSGPARVSMSGTSHFYSKGFASPKTITVIHDNYRQKVVININGRARVSDVY